MIEISGELKKFLGEKINKELLADEDILGLYKRIPTFSSKLGGELTGLLLDSGVDIWGYFEKEIPKHAFSSSTIKNVTIPNSVTSIGFGAFADCIALTGIIIPDNVTTIGAFAFYNCKSLTSVTIPDSVTNINSSAFSYCKSLTGVYITDMTAWCRISFGNNLSNPLYYAHNLYLNNELVTELTIPDDITSINDNAFHNCSSLTSVTIPSSVLSIGDYAFRGCNLTEVMYNGTKEWWEKVRKAKNWKMNSAIKTVRCTDGEIKV